MKLRKNVETVRLDMRKIAEMDSSEVLKFLHSQTSGLSTEEVKRRIELYGENEVQEDKKNLKLHYLKEAFSTPFTAILLFLIVLSFCSNYLFAAKQDQDLSTVIIMLAMILISGTISFIQNVKTDGAVKDLLRMISRTITVKRDSAVGEVLTKSLVPGDIVELSSGDVVPADIKLLTSNDLFCSTASLNGESQPVKKFVENKQKNPESILDLSNIVYEGSAILSGFAIGIVVATGKKTVFGSLARKVGDQEVKNTSFDQGISKISKLLLTMTLVITPIVFLINGLTKGNWLNALIFAIATAVGLTPEMLPVIVTSNLVKGSVELSKKGTIVKRLNSMQNLGSIDILCTDKTGTLTKEKIQLNHYVDFNNQTSNSVLKTAYLNASFQSGKQNLIDQAIVNIAKKQLNSQKIEQEYERIAEIPFDFKRRRLSVVLKKTDQAVLITKGAAEEMLNSANWLELNDQVQELTSGWTSKINNLIKHYNQNGFRVVLIGYKKLENKKQFSVNDENDLILTGILAFIDPPKESSAATLKQLRRDGIVVKILTGDNAAVTKNIAKQVGLNSELVYSESDLKNKTDLQMRQMVAECDLFVKLSPQMKAQIIELLKSDDHCVAYMGDGINDAAAMKAADVAISVESGTDIAKQCADIILLKKDLHILDNAVEIGRNVFGNTMKYLKITISSNFGNILSILVASSFLPFLPMMPLQLMVLDLIYGTSCLSIPFDQMNFDYLKIPRKWEVKKLPKFMFILGPTSSIFDILTFGILYFWLCPQVVGCSYDVATPAQKAIFAAVFCTGWFIESLWTQEMVIQVLRAPGLPFIKQHATKIVIFATIGVAALGTLLPYTAIGRDLNFIQIPVYYFIVVAVILFLYILLTSAIKKLYLKTESNLI